jgi:hypothetical protein
MAFPNDSSRIARALVNLESGTSDYTSTTPSGPTKAARSLIRKTYCLTEVPSVLANGDNAIVANAAPSVYFKNAVRVLGVTVQNRTSLTSSIANIQTLSLKPVSNVGVIGNTIATMTTKTSASGGTGNLVPGQKFSLTVQTANGDDRVAAGTWVGVAIAPSSSGVAIGATSWAIDVEEEGPDGYAV